MADDAGPAGGVSVMLRIRPRNAKEQEGDDCWSWSDDAIVEVGPSGNKRYAYDRCFAPGVGNKEVYECCGKPVVAGALRGVNGTIFTYGQTGSGKTHSILGVPSDPGIVQRTGAYIFAAVDERLGDRLHLIDRDNDGIVDVEEIRDALAAIALRQNKFREDPEALEAFIQVALREIDANSDDVITVEEVEKWFDSLEEEVEDQ